MIYIHTVIICYKIRAAIHRRRIIYYQHFRHHLMVIKHHIILPTNHIHFYMVHQRLLQCSHRQWCRRHHPSNHPIFTIIVFHSPITVATQILIREFCFALNMRSELKALDFTNRWDFSFISRIWHIFHFRYSNLSNTNSRQSIGNESDDYRKYRDVAL